MFVRHWEAQTFGGFQKFVQNSSYSRCILKTLSTFQKILEVPILEILSKEGS